MIDGCFGVGLYTQRCLSLPRKMAQLRPDDGASLLDHETWERPPLDLDAFFKGLYEYHAAHGLYGLVLNEVHDVLLHLGILIFVFAVGCMDWTSMLSHDGERDVLDYVQTPYTAFTVVWALFLALYATWRVVSLWSHLPHWWGSHQFFTNDVHDCQTKSWAEIVGEIVDVQRQGRRTLIVNGATLTPVDIASRILRRENYMVAMVEQDVLQTQPTDVAVWFAWMVILAPMFNAAQPWRLALTVKGVQRRASIALGLLIAAFPLLVALRLAYFALRAAERAASPLRTFAPRRWTVSTRWRAREYNEYPHALRRRLKSAAHDAERYLAHVPHPWTRRLLALASFWAGSVVGMITLLAALHEDALTELHAWDHNLLWWLALWSGIFACLRHLKPSGTESDQEARRAAWSRVVETLRIDSDLDIETRFPLFATEWMYSIVSLLRMPSVLWRWRQEAQASSIVSSIETMTAFDTRMGDVCSASLMATLPSDGVGTKYARSFNTFSDMYASVWDLQASLST